MTTVARHLGLGLCIVGLVACGDDGSAGDDETDPTGTDGGAPLECGDVVLPGHVVIETAQDLEQLDGVRVIEGELQLNRTTFTNVDFLGCIEEVGGELTLFGNEALDDLSGLDQLERTGGGMVISENPALTEIADLPSLLEVGDSLIIQGNDALTGISGMSSLATIGTSMIIRDNDALMHIDGLQGLRSVGALFAVTHNDSLCISSINTVGEGIVDPAQPRDDWSTRANDGDC